MGLGSTQIAKDIAKQQAAIEKYEKLQGRVKHTGDGPDLFAGVLGQKIDASEKAIKAMNEELDLVKLVMDMLNDYECEVTKAETAVYPSGYAGLRGLGGQSTTGGWR